jgi:prefoldin subunit 5
MIIPKAPVGHTCRDIDSAISSISDCQYYLNNLIQELEGLRNDNSALREWCESIIDLDVEKIVDENEYLKEEIEDLKTQITDLELQLDKVHNDN